MSEQDAAEYERLTREAAELTAQADAARAKAESYAFAAKRKTDDANGVGQ